MFKWQMYVSQKMRSQWNKYLGDAAQQTDEEEDMIKVDALRVFVMIQVLMVALSTW